MNKRTSASKKAKELVKHFRNEQLDYLYLREVFGHLRRALGIKVTNKPKKLPYVPSEEEITKYYKAVWHSRNMQNMVIIKTLLYTGIRVGELVKIKIEDVNLQDCTISVFNDTRDRKVPFPQSFKEVLAMHIEKLTKKGAAYLFESSWQQKYTERGIRKILMQYNKAAGMTRMISPHKLRNFLFTWMKKQNIEDAFLQPYSGHQHQQSLKRYSKLALTDAQKEYDKIIDKFPV